MKKEIDIHNFSNQLENRIKLLMNSSISQRNKDLILKFRDNCSLEGLSIPRIVKYMVVLRMWGGLLEFETASIQDVKKAVRIIQEKDYSSWTKSSYKVMLKRFFKWINNGVYPPTVSWINGRIKKSEQKIVSNSELLTENDVKKLIANATHPRDKAFLSVLYESGCRIGEIGSLQIGNIKIDEYGIIMNVTGKTGQRPIRLISSTPYLMTWYNNHPNKEKEAPLWVNVGCTNRGSAMKYGSIRMMLKRLFEAVEIKKKYNPHLFRHSRATFLADYLTEFQMNQYFGWIQGSNMPSTYIHMSGKKIDASILALNGIAQPKENKESKLKPKICPRCETINSHDANYCSKCAGILDENAKFHLEQQTERRSKADEMMNLLMKDKEFQHFFSKKIKSINLIN